MSGNAFYVWWLLGQARRTEAQRVVEEAMRVRVWRVR